MRSRVPAARSAVVALAVLVVVAAVAYQRSGRDAIPQDATVVSRSAEPAATIRAAAPLRSPRRLSGAWASAAAREHAAVADAGASSPSPQAAATPPPPVDLAALPRGSAAAQPSVSDDERFPTTRWFTAEDRDHPELYFELAARKPELNRPEERRAALAYFHGYREKLDRDLAAAGGDADARRRIEATIARYDAAIARMDALIAASRAER